MGPYIVDFVCHSSKLIIEADGGQHGLDAEAGADAERTFWLSGEGYRILRFWNPDIRGNMDGVMQVVCQALGDYPPAGTPHPNPPHQGEGVE